MTSLSGVELRVDGVVQGTTSSPMHKLCQGTGAALGRVLWLAADVLRQWTVPVGTFACDVMVSPDGQWAIVTNRLSGNITIIDTTTKFAVAPVATGALPQGVDFSADGTKAYVTNAGSTSVVDMASFTVVDTIANVPSGTCAVAVTMNRNNGKEGHVYVASNTTSGMVTVVDVGTNSVVAVFSLGVRPLGIGIRMWPRSL